MINFTNALLVSLKIIIISGVGKSSTCQLLLHVFPIFSKPTKMTMEFAFLKVFVHYSGTCLTRTSPIDGTKRYMDFVRKVLKFSPRVIRLVPTSIILSIIG